MTIRQRARNSGVTVPPDVLQPIPTSFDPARPEPESQAESQAEGPADRTQRIAEIAYRRAQGRGFEPGHELEDWLAAEQQIEPTHAEPPQHDKARSTGGPG